MVALAEIDSAFKMGGGRDGGPTPGYDDEPLLPVPEWEPILDRVRSLLPALRERAAAAREQRSVPKESIQALYDARILRYLQPRRYGGEALPWGVQFHVGRILSHACPSTAWIATVVASHMFYAGRFPEQAQNELFSSGPDVLIGMASVPVGVTATKVDGGHRISGRWKFVSGIDHETSLLLPVTTNLEDRLGGHMMMVHKSDVAIEDNWFVTGLKATGSKDVVLTDVFVPEHRALSFGSYWGANPPGSMVDSQFIRRRELKGYYGTSTLGPVVGTAEGALSAYVDLTRKRVSAMSRESVADSSVVQLRLAESASEIRTARLIVEHQLAFLRRCGEDDVAISDETSIELNRDRSLATRLCLDAVERLARHMGALGVFESNPVHAFQQDLKAAASQIALNFERNMIPYGRLALGLEAKPSM
jgi:3-hydroxy-9,10-secoandrosta-1,3,5(10)-triene-9,17-dione monooxygenase